MKHVGTRIMVLEKRANASRLCRLHASLGHIRTLTEAPSRKIMLSEKKATDLTSTANTHSRQKNRRYSAASSGKWNQRGFLFCFLGFGHVQWTLGYARSVATEPDDTTKQRFNRPLARCSPCRQVCHATILYRLNRSREPSSPRLPQ